jgi:hypothetical protein
VPPVKGVYADVIFAAKVFCPGAGFLFLEDVYDLFFRVSAIHACLLLVILTISGGMNHRGKVTAILKKVPGDFLGGRLWLGLLKLRQYAPTPNMFRWKKVPGKFFELQNIAFCVFMSNIIFSNEKPRKTCAKIWIWCKILTLPLMVDPNIWGHKG